MFEDFWDDPANEEAYLRSDAYDLDLEIMIEEARESRWGERDSDLDAEGAREREAIDAEAGAA